MTFNSADILLPNSKIDLAKWAVIACDQYTSQPEYWHEVEKKVGNSASALNIVLPEVYLAEAQNRTNKINETMKQYLADGTVEKAVENGFIYVERTTQSVVRCGLIGVVDLEEYDYNIGSKTRVRATEGTVISRIPPRVKIRENAPLEIPHVMLLINDSEKNIIEPLADEKETLRKLYDFDLMQGGGHIEGYAVEGAMAEKLREKIAQAEKNSGEIFLAAGDGNHSLATAKSCWEKIKETLTEEAIKTHPARYSLVELVNVHSDALRFEPIHRVIFGIKEDIVEAFERYLELNGMSLMEGNEITFTFANGGEEEFAIDKRGKLLPLSLLQKWLDKYVSKNKYLLLDYIHGRENVDKIVNEKNAVGILLQPIDKNSLFSAIQAGGVLPRKTFSIGEADEKRFYLEMRKIVR